MAEEHRERWLPAPSRLSALGENNNKEKQREEKKKKLVFIVVCDFYINFSDCTACLVFFFPCLLCLMQTAPSR